MRNSLIETILGLIFVTLFAVQSTFAQSNVGNLHRIKKIYIEATPNVKEERESSRS